MPCRDHAVHETHLQRLAGVDEARREDHLGGLGVADGGGEQQADPGIGSQGALGEHRREAGVLGGDADVAGQGESEAAAHGVPLNRGDGRLVDLEEVVGAPAQVAGPLQVCRGGVVVGGGDVGGGAQVGAGAEARPRAGEDDHARLGVGGGLAADAVEEQCGVAVDGVEPAGPVQRDRRDAIDDTVEDGRPAVSFWRGRRRRGGAHTPFQSGARFSRKARRPSSMS